MNTAYREDRVKDYLLPVAIVAAPENFSGAEVLTKSFDRQIYFANDGLAEFKSGSYIILDFGKEIFGGIRLLVRESNGVQGGKIRVRFGESVSETCSEIGESGACNAHNTRDQVLTLPSNCDLEFGKTGFRFVRIDFYDGATVRNIFASYLHRDDKQIGSFECSDENLNRIYDTAAYTLKLCMQNRLWDGIKRDQNVWVGDMHPETLGIAYLFGKNALLENSVDETREHFKLPIWVQNMPSYSIWFLQIVYDYFKFTGDVAFLERNVPYMEGVLSLFDLCVSENGDIDYEKAGLYCTHGHFLDWPTCRTPDAERGCRYLYTFVLKNVKTLFSYLNKDVSTVDKILRRLDAKFETVEKFKQSAAFKILAGKGDKKDLDMLTAYGAKGYSTFMSYYVASALAALGKTDLALDNLSEYYGAMLNRGATSFWEDFDMDWLVGSGRIDEFPKNGEKDLHGDFGNFCYKGYRHSLCHGWSCGPVPFFTENVLGVKVVDFGFKTVEIKPQLCSLKYAKGTVPTPFGIITVKHERAGDKIVTDIIAPDEIKIIRS